MSSTMLFLTVIIAVALSIAISMINIRMAEKRKREEKQAVEREHVEMQRQAEVLRKGLRNAAVTAASRHRFDEVKNPRRRSSDYRRHGDHNKIPTNDLPSHVSSLDLIMDDDLIVNSGITTHGLSVPGETTSPASSSSSSDSSYSSSYSSSSSDSSSSSYSSSSSDSGGGF